MSGTEGILLQLCPSPNCSICRILIGLWRLEALTLDGHSSSGATSHDVMKLGMTLRLPQVLRLWFLNRSRVRRRRGFGSKTTDGYLAEVLESKQ